MVNKDLTTQLKKPLELINLVRKHSNEGDLVLDTFAGTGTTAHAAFLLNRKFIVIEKELKYFEIIKKRIEDIKTNLT
jgi:DNA modification methylase